MSTIRTMGDLGGSVVTNHGATNEGDEFRTFVEYMDAYLDPTGTNPRRISCN
jgi:hypothetical protein